MKTNYNFMFLIPACISIYGLYTIMKIIKRVDVIETDNDTIMKTHLLYMESLEMHFDKIKTIENTIESIALSLPYKGTGWQASYYERKIARELKKHESSLTPPRFYDDEE
jgi:hypothetical protein